MSNLNKNGSAVAMVLIILGVLLYLVTELQASIYIYMTGALILTVVRFVIVTQNRSSEPTRLPQIHLLSAISLLVAGYMMYKGSNSSSVLFMISAFLEVYVSYRTK